MCNTLIFLFEGKVMFSSHNIHSHKLIFLESASSIVGDAGDQCILETTF